MPFVRVRRGLLPIAAILVLGGALAGCSGLTSSRTEGYALSEAGLSQIREGQSQTLVVTVLGSPQTRGSFGDESAFYYVQTRVQETAFGLRMVQDRTVLAVYFDKNNRVKDKAVYGLADGKLITIESRRTPSFGQDRTFIESIIASI